MRKVIFLLMLLCLGGCLPLPIPIPSCSRTQPLPRQPSVIREQTPPDSVVQNFYNWYLPRVEQTLDATADERKEEGLLRLPYMAAAGEYESAKRMTATSYFKDLRNSNFFYPTFFGYYDDKVAACNQALGSAEWMGGTPTHLAACDLLWQDPLTRMGYGAASAVSDYRVVKQDALEAEVACSVQGRGNTQDITLVLVNNNGVWKIVSLRPSNSRTQ